MFQMTSCRLFLFVSLFSLPPQIMYSFKSNMNTRKRKSLRDNDPHDAGKEARRNDEPSSPTPIPATTTTTTITTASATAAAAAAAATATTSTREEVAKSDTSVCSF